VRNAVTARAASGRTQGNRQGRRTEGSKIMALLTSKSTYSKIPTIHGRAKIGLPTLDQKSPNYVVVMTVP
jgi:hypothetical protein